MAYEVKYRTEFTDIHDLDWKVDILENDFSGEITTLVSTGDPLNFHYDNNSDSVFDPIRETHVDISVYSDINFALQDLYSIELLQFKVNIYAGEDLFFSGWIEPQNYEEVYEPVSYPVTISATCGLSELGDIEFKDEDYYYEGRRYESQVLLDILGEIGFETFNEYVNLYDSQMGNAVDDSVFDQALIDADGFRGMSCLEVLSEILKKYRSFIRQKDGVFNIVRPKELVGATVYGRNFTAYNTKTSITITPQQYINRSGYTSNRWQVPGGNLMIQAPYKKVLFNHDYGSLYSWIKNYNFDADTTTGLTLTGLSFEDWSIHGAPNVSPAGNSIISENQGCIIPYNASPYNNYIYQIFGHNAKTSATDVFAIEFDYMFYNSGSTIAYNTDLQIQILDHTGGSYLIVSDENNCEWDSSGYVTINDIDVAVGKTSWSNFRRQFVGLEEDGPYIIRIFPLINSNANVSLGIKNVRFYTSSAELVRAPGKQKEKRKKVAFFIPLGKETINEWTWRSYYELVDVKEKQYTSENDINGITVSEDFLLGDVVDEDIDNIAEQFEGALVSGSQTLLNRVDEVILTTDTGSGQALITCNGYSETAIWNTSLAQTALDFINNHNSDFPGVNVSTGGDGIIRFTHATAGVDFIGETTIENTIFDLQGYVSETQPSLYSSVITATESWSTRSGGENKTLIQLIADETALMYSRPKQLIQMPVWETSEALSFNTLGNLQDTLNTYSSAVRVFCMNRGEFKPREREWNIDLFEIGTGVVIIEDVTQVVYGYLYNWYAASEIDYLLAADGWHVPTSAEMLALRDYLDPVNNNPLTNVAGGLMKESGLIYWYTPNIGADNSVGFNGRGAGKREGTLGTFAGLLGSCTFWNTRNNSATEGGAGALSYDDDNFYDAINSATLKSSGCSIRLIKDSTTLSDGESGSYTGNDGKIYPTICIGTQEWLACNLAETLYRDGTPIPEVTENAAWAALETGARCSYNNDESNALETVSPIASATADSTLVIVDNTTITVDSTI